jgi:6-phosphogluconate dehydrogenase
VKASKILPQSTASFSGDKQAMIKAIGEAVYAAKIVSYAQGFGLMRAAEAEYGWKLNYGGIALMWRGGCIIRRAGFWRPSLALLFVQKHSVQRQILQSALMAHLNPAH